MPSLPNPYQAPVSRTQDLPEKTSITLVQIIVYSLTVTAVSFAFAVRVHGFTPTSAFWLSDHEPWLESVFDSAVGVVLSIAYRALRGIHWRRIAASQVSNAFEIVLCALIFSCSIYAMYQIAGRTWLMNNPGVLLSTVIFAAIASNECVYRLQLSKQSSG